MKKNRKIIIVLLILLAVGFAAVTATLVINGTTLFGAKTDDFDVIFTKAVIDGVENNAVISQDGKSITYETANLQVAGDTSVLDYTVTNNSSQYDAKVSIECDFTGNEYVTLENSLEDEVIEEKSEETGTLTATLIKTSTEERNQNFVCTIVAEAVEREITGSDPIIDGESSTYSLYGYLVDDNDNPLANHVVAYDNSQYVTSATDGYLYLENLEKGSHTLYVLNNVTIEDIENLSEEEIETQAITSADFTTGALNIVFPNGYRIIDLVIEKTKTITVSFDPNGADTEIEDKTYTLGKDVYGELPELTRDNYTFQGWYNEEENQVSSTTRVSETTTKLTAKWEANSYTIIFDANGGSGTMASQTYTYDIAKNLPINTFTREGYTFEGWNTASDGTGTTYEDTESVKNLTTINGGSITLYAKWKSAVSVNYEDTDGSGTRNIGDIITLSKEGASTERFYIISDDGDNIQMMSMYNLYIGNECTSISSCTAYTNPTGIQDSTMRGSVSDETIIRGATSFAEKGNEYISSTVEGYVNNYSSYLANTIGVENTATSISYDELIALGCSSSGSTCTEAPSFLYSTTYWTRSASTGTYVWFVQSQGSLGSSPYAYEHHSGVRPVVTIDAALLGYDSPSCTPVTTCNEDENICWTDSDCSGDKSLGDVVALGTEENSIEKFYTLKSDNETTQMLSMYNLHVGNEASNETGNWVITPYENPTGIQDSTMRGWISINATISRGATAFARGTSVYSGSIIEGYVNNYSKYISDTLGIENTATLISNNEVGSLGCTTSTCTGAPEWLYSTTYWTRSASTGTYVWYVKTQGSLGSSPCEYEFHSGVRPVVTISSSLFP